MPEETAAPMLVLGKSKSGQDILEPLCEVRHLLITGSSLSGKSTCMHALALGLIYSVQPQDLQLVIWDGSGAEFSGYSGLPHLLSPIIRTADRAEQMLDAMISEEKRRIRLFSAHGVQNMEAYRAMSGAEPLPYIVLLAEDIDHFLRNAEAQTLLSKVDALLCSGRTCGIYVIASASSDISPKDLQRFVSWFPSRICLHVRDARTSRLVLDRSGAELLERPGDALYKQADRPDSIPLFIASIENEDISAITEQVKACYPVEKAPSAQEPPTEIDPLFDQAVDYVTLIGRASTADLQRQLKIGYARATRLIDEMERQGIVGPYTGAKPRLVLVQMQRSSEPAVCDLPEPEPAAPVPESEKGNVTIPPSDVVDNSCMDTITEDNPIPNKKMADALFQKVLLPLKNKIAAKAKYGVFVFWSWLTEIPSLVMLALLVSFVFFSYHENRAVSLKMIVDSVVVAVIAWIVYVQPGRIVYELITRKTLIGHRRAVRRTKRKLDYCEKRIEELKKDFGEDVNWTMSPAAPVDSMNGHEFEQYCAALLRKNGFTDVQVTQASGDYGIDVLAHKDGISYAIQCKCYSGNVGNDAVQQAYSGKSYYNAMVAVVMTNRYFTQAAKETAAKNQVLLWDRDVLNEMQHSLQTN